jgi:predicted transcriptional regulator
MEKTTLYLPEATRRRLRDAARRTGRRQSELVRQAIDDFLSSEPYPLPLSIGAGEDEEVTGETSEDWLRRTWQPRID